MYEELEKTLDTYVRPLLRAHGGDMQVVAFTDGFYHRESYSNGADGTHAGSKTSRFNK